MFQYHKVFWVYTVTIKDEDFNYSYYMASPMTRKDESNSGFWVPEWARWHYLAHSRPRLCLTRKAIQ